MLGSCIQNNIISLSTLLVLKLSLAELNQCKNFDHAHKCRHCPENHDEVSHACLFSEGRKQDSLALPHLLITIRTDIDIDMGRLDFGNIVMFHRKMSINANAFCMHFACISSIDANALTSTETLERQKFSVRSSI